MRSVEPSTSEIGKHRVREDWSCRIYTFGCTGRTPPKRHPDSDQSEGRFGRPVLVVLCHLTLPRSVLTRSLPLGRVLLFVCVLCQYRRGGRLVDDFHGDLARSLCFHSSALLCDEPHTSSPTVSDDIQSHTTSRCDHWRRRRRCRRAGACSVLHCP